MIITSAGFNPNFIRDWYFQEDISKVSSVFGNIQPVKVLQAHGRYYVFGEAASRIAFSTDLTNWTIVDTTATPGIGFTDAAVSNTGVIIAISSSGSRLRSTNGIEWTALPNGPLNQSRIAFGGGVFVIAGGFGAMTYIGFRSTNNGDSWTEVSASLTSAMQSTVGSFMNSVQYQNGLFFVCGSNAFTGGTGNPRVASSPDGVTWTRRFEQTAATFGSDSVSTIVWNGTNYIVGGGSGQIWSAGTNFVWTNRTTGLSTTSWSTNRVNSLVWNGTRLLATGAGGAVAWTTSTTASTWTYVDDLAVNATWAGRPINSTLWDGSKFVSVGGGVNVSTLATSPTGLDNTWVYNNSLWRTGEIYGLTNLNDITRMGDVYVVVGDTGVLYSNDAATWTLSASAKAAFPTQAVRCVAANGTRFVAISDQGRLATSTDGETWTYSTALSSTAWGGRAISRLIWNGSMFMAVGANAGVATSTDGLTWTYQTGLGTVWGTGANAYVTAVVWDGTRFVVSSTRVSGALAFLGFATSTDGITWTAQGIDTAQSGGYGPLASDGNRYLSIGGNGRLAVSTNSGVTWGDARGAGVGSYASMIGTAGTDIMNDIIHVPGRGWYVCGQGNLNNASSRLLHSLDGITWSDITSQLAATNLVTKYFGGRMYLRLYWDSDRLIVIGERGQLVTQRRLD